MRRQNRPLLVFDTGGMFYRNPEELQRLLPLVEAKIPLITKSLEAMGYDAANVGAADLLLPPGMLADIDARSGFPFLSANLRDREGRAPFASDIIREFNGFRVGIFGLVRAQRPPQVSASSWPYNVLDPIQSARQVVSRLKKECDLVIALTSLGLEEDQRLALLVPGIDVILGGLSRKVTYQARQAGGTLIVQAGSKGMRIGSLRLEVRRGSESPWALRGGAGRTYSWSAVALDRKIPDHGDVAELLEEYKDKIRSEGIAQRVAPPSAAGRYTGRVACAECHPREFAEWAPTDHAHAFDTLVQKRQETNPDCLDCHVTGYGAAGGYSPVRLKPDLRGVQCEACHGPGRGHRGRGDIRLEVPEKVCRGCHNMENSPTFSYRRYLEKLAPHAR